MKQYDHSKIEKKWQKEWAKKRVYETEDSSPKPKFYILDMFPYPSGEGLHVGHPKGYIATDIVSRMKRMQGFNVLHPMGFDAFGLPAENYAIKTKTNPQIAVAKNVARYKKQLEIIGFDYDWSREVNTTDPKFYKWTQWIFLKLLEKGLAYESYEPINWCPSCKTGLANEDVEDGKCERCGTPVEKKPMRQWVLRITDYADRLLADLDTLDWPESIKESQRNWIGRSEGAEIEFAVKDRSEKIKVFTTRPDTLFGVTYIVVSPEHAFVTELLKKKETLKNREEVIRYVASARAMTEIERTDAKKDKTGVRLDGITAMNPANNEEVSVFVADYVLAEYGTGAVMAVPAHDERDFAFAKKFQLPIKHVIEPKFTGTTGDGMAKPGLPFVKRNAVAIVVRNPKDGTYLCNSWKGFKMQGLFTGGIEGNEDPVEAARREILEETGYKNLKFVRKSSVAINTFFYHRVKQQNRHAHFTFVFFDLENDERAAIDEKEAAIHEIVWKKKEELKNFFTVYEGSFILNIIDNDDYVHIEPGILANSGKFDGFESEEAKKKITEAVGGKWVVKYKLKDWVFSRQRYWGEPFPILHAPRAKKALLIHGFEGDGAGHWFKKLKKSLEDRGVEVSNPTISTSKHPTVESWMDELLPLVKDFGPDDIVIGHSLGSNAALRLVESSGRNIGRLFLVASAIGKFRDERDWTKLEKSMEGSDVPALKKFWESPIDYARIAELAPEVLVIRSKDDVVIPSHAYELPTAWKVEEWDGFGHFDSAKGTEFDALWKRLESFMPHEVVPVSEEDLPVELPKVKSYEPTGTGESPLAAIDEWVNVRVGKGKGAKILKRETNTMPQWAGSSWYYLRYMDPKNGKALVDEKKEKYWNQVDFYVGGAEHATRHLIYARFWHKFLYDIGAVSTTEPFKKLQSVGLIMGEDGRKMSKRFGNVVNPDDIVGTYGADTMRVYEMFMGPFDQAIAWSTSGMIGARRFLERVWNMRAKVKEGGTLSKATEMLLHRTIKKVSEDMGVLRHNTAVSSLMILSNEFDKEPSLPVAAYETLLKLLAPLAPHMTEELWAALGNKKSIHVSTWPVADESKTEDDIASYVVQINGKVRASFKVPKDTPKETIESLALRLEEIKKWVGDKKPEKVIVVPGKLVSIVVKN